MYQLSPRRGAANPRVTVRSILVVAVAVLVAYPASAQIDPNFGGQEPNQNNPKAGKKKDEEYVRPKEALEPLPEPLSPDEEKARERAKERGVLISDKPEPGYISELRIEGARKIEPDAILVQVQTRINKKPDARTIQADIRRIYQMDIFDDVVVESRPGKNDSLVIVFKLREKPSINDVIIQGNKDVSKEDIAEVIDIKPYQVLDVAKVRANVGKIQKLYVDKGYFLAEVTYEIKKSTGVAKKQEEGLLDLFKKQQKEEEKQAGPTVEEIKSGDFVDVIFTIKEQAKVKIDRVTFVGNDHLSPDEFTQYMRTHEAHPLGVLNEWGTYKEDQIETDLQVIEQVYQDKGYINVKVGKPRIQLSPDRTRMAIQIPITEGKSYKLRSLTVKGDLLVEKPEDATTPIYFVRDDIMKRTHVKAGDTFSRTQVAIDVNNIADRYRDKGYAYVNISPDTVVHEEDNSVDLALAIESGPRVTVERIEVTGNNKTQDRVIRREMRIYEGEWYSASAVRISEQRVNALGFFEKVNLTTKQGSKPDRMILVFDVKEKSTGTFQLGAGFSNAENLLFTGQIAYNNFLGLGTTVSGSVQWSSLRRIFDFQFVDPYAFTLNQQPVTVALSAFNTAQFFLDFERDSTGANATVGYPIGSQVFLTDLTKDALSQASPALLPYIPNFENLQMFLSYNLERVVIGDTQFQARLIGLQSNLPHWTTSLKAAVVFDQRNNRLFPSAGWFVQGSFEFAHPIFGSALLPPAEAAVKSTLQKPPYNLTDSLGFLYKNGEANTFYRTEINARAYMNFDEWLPLKGVVLKDNAQYGWILASQDLIFENYYMGGFNTIRGYFLRSISPVQRVGPTGDPSNPLTQFRTGGSQEFFNNLELEFPVIEQVGIRGVLFFDAGNVYAPGENLFYIGNGPSQNLLTAECGNAKCWDPHTQLPLGLFYSVGLGVRWFSPIGPLRFELGFPLTPRPVNTFGFPSGDQPFQFEFNVGNSF
jgi:outer membrane protein insertion porin family